MLLQPRPYAVPRRGVCLIETRWCLTVATHMPRATWAVSSEGPVPCDGRPEAGWDAAAMQVPCPLPTQTWAG